MVLNDVQCLSPVAHSGSSADSEAGIRRPALAFPLVILDEELSTVTDRVKTVLTR